ncbi:PriCT-2 domain-containing protein [Pseudomonas sp. LFM046]|uniref:DUF5906 domain-containing protein n=1 Tax=Pseudomonas sp. LFM046 TaxID=1608357 RepID=UPI0006971583|nr:PriCT-2 domain-containing protein [Pseudomonas sp. LFM046]
MHDHIPLALSDLHLLLSYIPATDRETWLQVGMGIKAEFGQNGFDAWDTWSQTGTGYNLRDAKTVWRSFKKGGVGLGTVIKLAQGNGWKPERTEMTREDRQRLAEQHESRRKARQAEVEADEAKAATMRAAVADACSIIWQQHVQADGASAYLARKGVGAHGVGFLRRTVVLEIDDQSERCQIWAGTDAQTYLRNLPKPRPAHLSMLVMRRGDLVIPLRDASGALHALQHIGGNGTKLFPKYGRKSGCFHVLTELDGAEVIGLAEGYATAASCVEASGWPVVMAVDSGNLPAVARALREQFPVARLVLCGDDDPAKPGNPGRSKAEAAALEVSGVAVFPTGADGKDWNDLHQAAGRDVVREQLLAALALQPVVRSALDSVGDDLPPTPSGDAAEAAAPTEGGGGSAVDPLERLIGRYALVEGDTKVFDLHGRVVMKKSAFELLVTRPLAKRWYDFEDKKCISPDLARRMAEQAVMDAKGKRGREKAGAKAVAPTERYVYIDGTQDIWDDAKRRRIPVAALRVALGDAFSLWLNSDERRVVDQEHLVFDPRMEKDPSIYINTFDGLPMVPGTDFSKCTAILQMVNFLCNDDEAAVRWLLCWLALPLQKVGSKMATAVLMHSTMEGSGKSLLLSDIMREIYGAYGATVGQTQLESQWSAWQSNKLFGVFEEVVSRDQRYNQVGKIKHMVTGKTMRIESKFISGWEETNYMNAVFLSNEIIPWPIAPDDRRLLVIWPELTLQGELLERVIAEIKDGGIQALYGYLLQHDVGDFHAHTRPPKTAARQRLVDLSLASWQTFLAEWRAGYLGDLFKPCVSSDLYCLFLEWCSRNKEHTLSHTKFSGFIGTQVPKEKGVPWYDGKRRAFGTFFFPCNTVDPSPPPSLESKALGQSVEAWRASARLAGWHVDNWDHMKKEAA